MNATTVSNRRLVAITTIALLLSVVFFAPRLWLMRHYVPGSFQWERAHTFLLQCEAPLRRDIEPAMLWRLLPPAVCHALRLPGWTPLIVPWLGAIIATIYVAVLYRRRCDDWRFVAGGVLLFATTSAVLVPTGWLGMNDGWVWLGLLAVAFGRTGWALPLACLLCPWIDERFIIGFPLACWIRQIVRAERATAHLLQFAWLLPYAAIRLWFSHRNPTIAAASGGYLSGQFSQILTYLPLAPLGWWMGLRVAWIPVGYGIAKIEGRDRWILAAIMAATVGASVALASDLSRSIAILTPAVCLGCFLAYQHEPVKTPSRILFLGVTNLVIPAAHVTYTKIDPISILPVELLRWLRIT